MLSRERVVVSLGEIQGCGLWHGVGTPEAIEILHKQVQGTSGRARK